MKTIANTAAAGGLASTNPESCNDAIISAIGRESNTVEPPKTVPTNHREYAADACQREGSRELMPNSTRLDRGDLLVTITAGSPP
jgi:hypothetical protein